jgi:hypothetical protein
MACPALAIPAAPRTISLAARNIVCNRLNLAAAITGRAFSVSATEKLLRCTIWTPLRHKCRLRPTMFINLDCSQQDHRLKPRAVSSLAAFDKLPAEEIAPAGDYGTRTQTNQNST